MYDKYSFLNIAYCLQWFPYLLTNIQNGQTNSINKNKYQLGFSKHILTNKTKSWQSSDEIKTLANGYFDEFKIF